MKKLLALVLLAVLALAGCGKAGQASSHVYAAPPASGQGTASGSHPLASVAAPTGDVVEIREKLFIAQTNNIYLNWEDYEGKTIRYEGIYLNSSIWDNYEAGLTHFVIRYGPGCCPGADDYAGFEVRWNGAWPEMDAWVEVTGVLTTGEMDGYPVKYVEVTSMVEKQTRGAEYVMT